MRHTTSIIVATVLFLHTHAGAQEQARNPADDPLLGTWRLNVAKSTYKPGPPPKSQVRTYEKHQFGIKATVKTVFVDGRSTTVQSIYEYGKEEYPVTGSEDVDSIVVSRLNPYLHEATLSHGGHEIGMFRREISRDGTRMTVTLKRQIPEANNVEVYEKEKSEP